LYNPTVAMHIAKLLFFFCLFVFRLTDRPVCVCVCVLMCVHNKLCVFFFSNPPPGEATIRTAFDELRTWKLKAVFALTDATATATAGAPVRLIRDWKDAMTEVGDNQSLLASLRDSPLSGRCGF
jgi:hypothetical protein